MWREFSFDYSTAYFVGGIKKIMLIEEVYNFQFYECVYNMNIEQYFILEEVSEGRPRAETDSRSRVIRSVNAGRPEADEKSWRPPIKFGTGHESSVET